MWIYPWLLSFFNHTVSCRATALRSHTSGQRDRHPILLAVIDLEKAFNRVSHMFIIEDRSDRHVPVCLLAY